MREREKEREGEKVLTPSSPVREREIKRERGRERKRETKREGEREGERAREREREKCKIWLLNLFHCFNNGIIVIFIFKRNDGCLGTF